MGFNTSVCIKMNYTCILDSKFSKKFPGVTPAANPRTGDRGEVRGCKVHPTKVSHKSMSLGLGATVVKQLPSCYNS